jgi:hypothetical protein
MTAFPVIVGFSHDANDTLAGRTTTWQDITRMGVDPLFLTVDDKPMEMAVHPPQDELKDMVKISDGGIRGNEKTTPDQGTDATQGNLELVNNSIW